ncbi:MAG TPA: AGE family epimerase/isomerase [Saprospiraceae bacterium]|nr:AGE family epimerase/isomerase [Saprospiraceae bacterium]
MKPTALQQLSETASNELENILNWWSSNMIDRQHGGFYGRIDGYGKLHPEADKGVILNTRILWAFSAAAKQTGSAAYRVVAERAYDYLICHFVDDKFGGVYWMLDFRGNPVEPKKQLYAQAFAVYALSEYYLLTRQQEVIKLAEGIFHLIEKHSRDNLIGGYFEAFARDWSPLGDLRLSEKDANEAKTMNTHLHVLEAYTTLYRASGKEEVRASLHTLIVLFLEKFIDPATAHLRLFFDENWVLKSDKISFGHDIETAWLLPDAAEALGDTDLLDKTRAAAIRIADRTLSVGFDPANGGLWNEADAQGLTDRDKEWWPQIEAVVGFLHVWNITAEHRHLEAALRSWDFIERYLLDREGGEWFWGLKADGTPDCYHDKAGPWKCPYHNGRGCLKIMELGLSR